MEDDNADVNDVNDNANRHRQHTGPHPRSHLLSRPPMGVGFEATNAEMAKLMYNIGFRNDHQRWLRGAAQPLATETELYMAIKEGQNGHVTPNGIEVFMSSDRRNYNVERIYNYAITGLENTRFPLWVMKKCNAHKRKWTYMGVYAFKFERNEVNHVIKRGRSHTTHIVASGNKID